MSVIDHLSSELARLPGIGPKTALRLVHHLMKGSKHDVQRLSKLVVEPVSYTHLRAQETRHDLV